ncbi:hypothetical protein [Flagellimonas olearia]|uniref:DUF4412 domain-containing protein n=1 Tax=Flagellimonas olearia TaxID=552546 RepID=A0A444VND3_9FLAO|nr:hypothetical protein [Allomuricauda olearia]RYC52324.1 hypothetical protein DN53_10610 [Allomuricauda olearia]
MTRYLLILMMMVFGDAVSSQTFEGSITYKIMALNPEPTMIPDSIWQQGVKSQFGDRGYMLQKYHYKHANYISEIDAGEETGFQSYDPKKGLLYSWQKDSDTAIMVNTKKETDTLIEIYDAEQTDTIMGIPCKSIVVKSNMGEMTLWYNPDYFKMDPSYYKKHRYGHWDRILAKIGCLPLKMEQKKFMSHIVQIMVDHKEIAVDKERFEIPKFREIIESPTN